MTENTMEINTVPHDKIPIIAQQCFSDSIADQERGCNILRKLTSTDHSPPIDKIVTTGVIPQLIKFLQPDINHGNENLLRDAIWLLGNIGNMS